MSLSNTLARSTEPYESAAVNATHGACKLQFEQTRQQLHPIDSRSLRDLVEIVSITIVH
jgi:hypothetical protein